MQVVHFSSQALPRESASGEPPRGGNRSGGFSTQQHGGGGGWRSGGRESEGGRRGGRGGGGFSRGGRGGGTGPASNMNNYGYEANGYGNENNGWNVGWNPNVADPNVGYDQSCGTAYPGYGQPSSQQHQPLQQNYGVGSYGSGFGQNYAQQQGGGPMKGSSGGRPNPYGPPVNFGN